MRLMMAAIVTTTLGMVPLIAADNEPVQRPTIYGRRLENRTIVTSGVPAPKAAARLLSLLNRYSFREGTD